MKKKANLSEQTITDSQKIMIEKCCQVLSVAEIAKNLNLSVNSINKIYDESNKLLGLSFDKKLGSVSMTEQQSMKDDTIIEKKGSIYDSPKYKGCVHRT
jgi:predicted DNA-binding protein YlxM (UPF0122 family)